MWGSRSFVASVMVALCAAVPVTIGQEPSVATSVSVAPALPQVQAQPADSLVDAFGVQTHLGYAGTPYTNVASTKRALVDLGVRHVRDNLNSGKPAMYAAMREIAATGIRFNLIMGIPGSWDTPANLVKTLKENIPTGVVESLEGANEWNLKNRTEWFTELRAHQQELWRAAKAEPVTRDLPILAPALGQQKGFTELGDLTGFADFGNAHYYPGGQQPSVAIDALTAAERTVVPGKPVIFTESGYHTALNTESGHRPTLEAAAKEYAPRMLLEHYLRGTERLYMYELFDQRRDTELIDHEGNFGLIRNDGTPKPSYVALRNLLGLAADPGAAFEAGSLAYRLEGAPADTRQLLLQKRDGTFMLLLWRDVSIYDRINEKLLGVAGKPVTVRLGEPADVEAYQPSQSAEPFATVSGTQGTVSLGGSIVALEIDPHRVVEPVETTEPVVEPTPPVEPVETPSPVVEPSPMVEPAKTTPSAPRKLTVKTAMRASTVRWLPPLRNGGARITGYTVTEQVSGKTVKVGPGRRNVRLRTPLTQRKVKYVVSAHNRVGDSPRSVSRVLRLR